MDDITKKNEKLWDNLSRNDVLCSRINFDMTPEDARENLDPFKLLGDVKGKNVLCLASAGGQQSVGFALLGANVTVVDFSEEQLSRDKEAAEKLDLKIRTIKSDMRDLSMLDEGEFDIVYQPYSINYVSDTTKVFDGVSRILKSGGIYHLMFHNPFVHGSWKEGAWGSEWKKEELWREKGYPIYLPYKDGYPISLEDPTWNFENTKGETIKAESPQEFKHTLSTIINSLIERNFNILKFNEVTVEEYEGMEVGSWDHYVSIAAPWLFIWAKKL